MTTTPDSDLLDRVRKLLAKAEDDGCTPAEAEALTAKAAELMARYGIDRALLGALHPETDRPADRKFGFERPWADVKAHLLAAVATALRCQCVQTTDRRRAAAARLRLLLRPGTGGDPLHLPARADGAGARPGAGPRRREQREGLAPVVDARLLLGGRGADPRRRGGSGRVRGARRGRQRGLGRRPVGRAGARRPLAEVRLQVTAAYPRLKQKRVTYSGGGYGAGYREGQKADIGGAKIRSRSAGALGR